MSNKTSNFFVEGKEVSINPFCDAAVEKTPLRSST